MKTWLKTLAACGIMVYLAYLLSVTWGVGKLSVDVNRELDILRCIPDCKIKREAKDCRAYCGSKVNKGD